MIVGEPTMSLTESGVNPLVTVYVTNFNYANYIKQSIESVLAQTYKNFELIIIDDGSTDNSREIINRYVEKKNIRAASIVLHQSFEMKGYLLYGVGLRSIFFHQSVAQQL